MAEAFGSRGRVSHRPFSQIKSRPRPLVTAQGRIRGRLPIRATIIGDSELPSGDNPDLIKENQIWAIREKKIRAEGNNKKRPSSI